MSYHGQSPRVSRLRVTPLSSDPVNPAEGDLFYSDGTPRDEGLWVYTDGAWAQFSTGAAISTLPNLTLTPQSSDPGSPAEGMLFISDGTARAEGLWQYMNGDWVQLTGERVEELTFKDIVEVRAASTANVTLASQVESGDTIDGIVLATNDLVLLKNQTTATENGVYVVQTSGAPTRHSSADTAAELNDYVAYVSSGTTNGNTLWYQTATISNIASDNQTWASSPANKSFVVPEGVYELRAFGVGAGGGGGGGGGRSTSGSGGGGAGGGGGGGGRYGQVSIEVVPGETLTIALGAHGIGGEGGTSDADNATAGSAGGTTQILRSATVLCQFSGGSYGGKGGGGTADNGGDGGSTEHASGGTGGTGSANSGAGGGGGGGGFPGLDGAGDGSSVYTTAGGTGGFSSGGGGGAAQLGTAGSDGGAGGGSDFASGGAGGASPSDGGGGGGGGASFAAGGAGGTGGAGAGSPADLDGSHGNLGSGGGGGGGSGNNPATGGKGGCGGGGYVRFNW